MSSPFKSLGRRFALVGALTALAMGVIVPSAFAELTLSNSGPFGGEPEGVINTVTAKATGKYSTAAFAAFAECNVAGINLEEPSEAEEVEMGERCAEPERVLAPAPLSGGEGGARVATKFGVFQVFDDWDYTVQPEEEAGTSTTCKGEAMDDQCAVVVSWYSSTFSFVGAEGKAIQF